MRREEVHLNGISRFWECEAPAEPHWRLPDRWTLCPRITKTHLEPDPGQSTLNLGSVTDERHIIAFVT